MSTVIKYITSGGLYVVFGLWSFFQVLEYKYYTRVEQYDTIVENMRICKQKYGELLLKMRQLEDRVDELEDILLEHNLEDDEEKEEHLEEEKEEHLEEEKLTLDTEALNRAEEEANEIVELNTELNTELNAELNANEIVVKEDLEVELNANEVAELEAEAELESELESELNANEQAELNANEIVEVEELEAEVNANEVAEEDDEMVDISEETYPIKNQVQNKKGWLKTILFM